MTDTEPKWLGKSKTFWGILIGAAPGLLLTFGIELDPDFVQNLDTTVLGGIGLAGLIWAIYGRVKAGGVYTVRKPNA